MLLSDKTYESHFEERFRLKIYKESRARVERHNLQHAMGEHTYTIEINQFSDMVRVYLIYTEQKSHYI